MGYYTCYTLEFETDERRPACNHNKSEGAKYCPECGKSTFGIAVRDQILEYIKGNENMLSALGEDGESGEACKWYEHNEDMAKLSKAFPTVLFTLSGEGEENEDLWKQYWLGGKYQEAKAKIAFDKFDKSKLVTP